MSMRGCIGGKWEEEEEEGRKRNLRVPLTVEGKKWRG